MLSIELENFLFLFVALLAVIQDGRLVLFVVLIELVALYLVSSSIIITSKPNSADDALECQNKSTNAKAFSVANK